MIETTYGHPAVYINYYDKQFTQPRKQYNIQQAQEYLYKDHHRDETFRQRDNMQRYFSQNNHVRVKNTNFNMPVKYNINDYFKSLKSDMLEDEINGEAMKQEYYRNDAIIYGKKSQKRFMTMTDSERRMKM
eukprot:757340-Hanusia_phi.AAC.1